MAQIDWKLERKLKRIDPINDQIIARWSMIDRVIGSEYERDLSNPGYKKRFVVTCEGLSAWFWLRQ
jgi:hypothetical protein